MTDSIPEPAPSSRDSRTGFWEVRIRWWGILRAGMSVTVAVSLAGFFTRVAWRFEQLCHFRPQFFIVLAVCAMLFLAGKKFKSAALAGAVAALNLAFILPLYLSGATPTGDGPRVRILMANVHTANLQHERVKEYVRTCNADVVALLEVDDLWMKSLSSLDAEYPHAMKEERQDNFGMALWSRRPFLDCGTRYFGEAGLPTIDVLVEVKGVRLRLLATHPLPPTSAEGIGLRDEHLSLLARYVESLPGAKVIVGDLNTTSWSPCFGELERESGLRDSRRGFGVQPSWPAGLPWLWVPIDHCLVSSDVGVISREVGPDIGSDHYPVLIELSLPPAAR